LDAGQGIALSTHLAKTWRLLPHDSAAVERLANQLGMAPVVAQLLLNRGVRAAEDARRFLEIPFAGLYQPDLLPGVANAADRLHAAVRAGKRICIYGDYDVDGVTGTAILVQGLRLLDAKVHFYVPHRLEEGYGLNCDALRQIASDGTAVVVTVDCGIASVREAEEAKRLGLELIVTDHHEFKATLPDAAVLVHPRLPGTVYPFGRLSGSAVAFKLAWALAQRACGGPKVTPRFRDYLLDSVGLAALGVVADVVPLQDENRILVHHGVNRLRQTPMIGLKALYEAAGLGSGEGLRASDIGYTLAPRMNAAGRLGCARLVVELLTTSKRDQAAELARCLEDQNQKRQILERRMLAEARALVETNRFHEAPAIVVANSGWHAGVIGIVAGRLADLYGRPALMVALPTGPAAANDPLPVGIGSGRSIPGFALHEALEACTDLLIGHGGHAMAAGFRVHLDKLNTFRERLCQHTAKHFPAGGPPAPALILDAETPLSALTPGLLRDLDRLEPYGAENRKPMFLAGNLDVVGEPRRVGTPDRHLSFRVRQNGTVLKAIGFGMADRVEELMSAGGACCLAFTPKMNEWQGWRSVDLVVTDFQAGAEARLE
jgi:single-stranded-DNA-specific exonuclease